MWFEKYFHPHEIFYKDNKTVLLRNIIIWQHITGLFERKYCLATQKSSNFCAIFLALTKLSFDTIID